MPIERFIESLQQILEHEKLSVSWLSEKIGVSRMTIYRLINGKNISLKVLNKITEALNRKLIVLSL